MAERRMFTEKITESDAFLDMPLSTQCLYFHFCMNADDDGFVKNPKRIQRMLGASDDDSKLLIAKSFTMPFESGVIVIKHWRMHNLLRKDRYKETEYLEEKSMLYLKENGAYTFDETQGKKLPKIGAEIEINSLGNQVATNGLPSGNQLAPQDSIGKYSIELDKNSKELEENKENIVSMYVSTQESACTHKAESYEEIMDGCGVDKSLRFYLWEFIKHCQANGHTLINSTLLNIIARLDMAYGDSTSEKIKCLRKAIAGGYFDIKEK